MIVLDAAALVEVVLDQPDGPWVLAQLEGATLCAPAHQPAEVLSAVARLVRAGALTREAGRDAIEEAHGLEQELVAPIRTHLLRALELGDRIRVLDGLYVALAESRDATLVTTDGRLARAQLPVDVRTPELG